MKYVQIDGDTAILKVKGRFDLVRTEEADGEIDEALINHGCRKLILDLSETTFLDSAAIRTINDNLQRVGRDNFEARNAVADEVALEMLSSELDEAWNLTPPLNKEYYEKNFN